MEIYRCQKRFGGVDITVGSGVGSMLELAPTLNMVMQHKGRWSPVISDEQYTELYLPILDLAYTGWQDLRAMGSNNRVIVACYCADGKFCHTYLLGLYASLRWPHLFEDKTGSRRVLLPGVINMVETFVKANY